MNEQEAIKLMLNEIVCINTADHNECERDCANCSLVKETDELLEGYNIAIKALEKQIPYKPKVYEDKYYGCKCGNVLLHKWKKYNTELMPKTEGLPYCLNCGQKLDWSDEE